LRIVFADAEWRVADRPDTNFIILRAKRKALAERESV